MVVGEISCCGTDVNAYCSFHTRTRLAIIINAFSRSSQISHTTHTTHTPMHRCEKAWTLLVNARFPITFPKSSVAYITSLSRVSRAARVFFNVSAFDIKADQHRQSTSCRKFSTPNLFNPIRFVPEKNESLSPPETSARFAEIADPI